MASNVIKPSLLRNVVKRGYAAQAAAEQSSFILPQHEPKLSVLPSGAVVASLENNAPVSQVAVLFKAGSRYENASNSGASHVVRASAGHATKNLTAFGITRTIQQSGGVLTSESGREHILYSVNAIRDSLDTALGVLGEVSTQPAFKPWELSDDLIRIKDELATRDATTLAMEGLHSAAFRNSGLGNSIFVPAHHVGKLSTEQLGDFVASTHTASRMSVVGLGVSHDALVSFANGLGIGSDSGVSSAAAFGGGEVRNETGSPLTVVTVAGSGAGIGSGDAAALAVAQYILGAGPGTKRGSNSSGVLSGAVAASGGVGVASAINVNYSDAGLFGYCVIAESGSVGKVVSSVHNAVKSLTVTDAQVENAKKAAKTAILMGTESSADAIEDMGLQGLLTGGYVAPTAAAAAIDGVTTSAVQAALAKVVGGKLALSAVGSLQNVPYLDQL